MGTQPPATKGTEPHPIFGPRLLWPNDCMDQDATWYGGRPRPTRHCVRGEPSYPQKKGTSTPTQFLAYVYCGQMAGWMKTPLGTEVDLGPGHTVLDGVTAPRKGHSSPLFSAHVYCGHGCPSQLLLSSCNIDYSVVTYVVYTVSCDNSVSHVTRIYSQNCNCTCLPSSSVARFYLASRLSR